MRTKFASALLSAVTLATPTIAMAQAAAPNPQAESLNDAGKELFKGRDYQGAAAKFREAITLAPDARYYFNLCATLEKTGDYDAALEACDAVYANAPSDELKGKTGQRAAAIRAAKREAQPNPVPTDPNLPNPQPGDPNQPQPVPDPVITQPAPAPPQPDYRWGFGGAIAPAVGTVDDRLDPGVGGGVYLWADRLFAPKIDLGVRFSLDFGNVQSSVKDPEPGFEEEDVDSTFIEIGAGLYKHIKLGKNLAITPSAHVLLTGWIFSNATTMEVDETNSFTGGSIGGRLGVSADFVFGEGKHAVSIAPAISFYSGGTASTEGTDVDGFSIPDQDYSGGAVFALMLGYTARFSTGDIPGFTIVNLE